MLKKSDQANKLKFESITYKQTGLYKNIISTEEESLIFCLRKAFNK